MSYIAPVKDMLFNMAHLGGLEQIAQMPAFEDAGLETAQAVLEECAKLNESVLVPLNWKVTKTRLISKTAMSTPRLVSKRPMPNTERVDGKVCNTRQPLVDKACPKPLARPVAKF
jgi:hypothetical protein